MAYLLTIPHDLVSIIAILLLLGPITLSFFLYWISKSNRFGNINNIVSKIFITPFSLESLRPELQEDLSISDIRNRFTEQLNYRLLFIYGGILLFLLGTMIGEFYLIFVDVSQPITQGSTGDQRVWSSIVFTSPFSGGWLGFFPWYGNLPLPPINLDSFHDPWSWIFYTASQTDNPFFIDEIVWQVFYGSIFIGLLFLIPLSFNFVRKSFIPSLFFFFTGMLITTKGLFTCFSQAFKLEFASGSITYGIQTITKTNLESTTDLLVSFIFPILFIIVILFVFFVFLGRKVWRNHYPNHQASQSWFLIFLTISFWGSLVILMV